MSPLRRNWKLVRSRFKLTSHVNRMKNGKLAAKRADPRKCRRKDLERVGEEWRKIAINSRNRRLLVENFLAPAELERNKIGNSPGSNNDRKENVQNRTRRRRHHLAYHC